MLDAAACRQSNPGPSFGSVGCAVGGLTHTGSFRVRAAVACSSSWCGLKGLFVGLGSGFRFRVGEHQLLLHRLLRLPDFLLLLPRRPSRQANCVLSLCMLTTRGTNGLRLGKVATARSLV